MCKMMEPVSLILCRRRRCRPIFWVLGAGFDKNGPHKLMIFTKENLPFSKKIAENCCICTKYSVK